MKPHHSVSARHVAEQLVAKHVPEHFGRLRRVLELAVDQALRDRDAYWIARLELVKEASR